ncbi:hypothetical protein V8C44DRAFT_353841 [Trichoderma aethiopicum]
MLGRIDTDDQQTDLILSFIQNHNTSQKVSPASSSSSSALLTTNGPLALRINVNVGNSQSSNILLSSHPGTGTILTAEAVADRTDRPLFYLQAKGLGINAASLGTNISRVDIHWNELASIFLRELGYFRGIKFLTTTPNHTTTDNAVRMIKSRCDHKGYPTTLERPERGIKVTSPDGTREGYIDKGLYSSFRNLLLIPGVYNW